MVVIGAGRVGTALHEGGQAAGVEVDLVSRDAGWEVLDQPPGRAVLVATRNDDLADVIARVPEDRRPDLVFVQNGMVRPFLEAQGLADAGRGLLFFAVQSQGAEPVPGPPSPFTGPHAEPIAAFLDAVGLGGRAVDAASFAALEVEKLSWNCAFGLLCEAHDATVGEVVAAHRDELDALDRELLAVCAAALDVRLEPGPLVQRHIDYSLSIADYRGAVKEWRWRNGWFVEAARTHGVATPVHHRLLGRVGRG